MCTDQKHSQYTVTAINRENRQPNVRAEPSEQNQQYVCGQKIETERETFNLTQAQWNVWVLPNLNMCTANDFESKSTSYHSRVKTEKLEKSQEKHSRLLILWHLPIIDTTD